MSDTTLIKYVGEEAVNALVDNVKTLVNEKVDEVQAQLDNIEGNDTSNMYEVVNTDTLIWEDGDKVYTTVDVGDGYYYKKISDVILTQDNIPNGMICGFDGEYFDISLSELNDYGAFEDNGNFWFSAMISIATENSTVNDVVFSETGLYIHPDYPKFYLNTKGSEIIPTYKHKSRNLHTIDFNACEGEDGYIANKPFGEDKEYIYRITSDTASDVVSCSDYTYTKMSDYVVNKEFNFYNSKCYYNETNCIPMSVDINDNYVIMNFALPIDDNPIVPLIICTYKDNCEYNGGVFPTIGTYFATYNSILPSEFFIRGDKFYKSTFKQLDSKYLDIFEIVSSDTLTWDGNTDGLVYKGDNYKISDCIPTKEDILKLGRVKVTYADEVKEIDIQEDMITEVDGEILLGGGCNIKIITSIPSYENFPETGIYFNYNKWNDPYMFHYTSELQLNGYDFTSTKLKKTCIPESVKYTQSDYAENNRAYKSYIKNRPFYSINDTLNWNGDSTGISSSDIMEESDGTTTIGYWIKVSDVIPAYKDFVDGGFITKFADNVETIVPFTQDELVVSSDGTITGFDFYVDSTGIWFFAKTNDGTDYLASLVINGYDGFSETVKQLEEKYIPDIDWGTKVSNKPFDSMDALKQVMLDFMYPVGHILMNNNSANPSTYLGGTWVSWGSGRVPVGVDASDTDFASADLTGGEKTHTLSVNELASHTHSVGAHNHGLNSHTHSIPALTGTAASAGAHSHNMRYSILAASGSAVAVAYANGSNNIGNVLVNNGAHTHDVTTKASTTGKASGNTANSTAFNSGSAGTGAAHNNLQPYITCYMWLRTA